MKTTFNHESFSHIWSRSRPSIIVSIILIAILLGISSSFLTAQTTTHPPLQVTLSGTLHMYLITLYGDSLQEIDYYKRAQKEGECITFILKTDKPVDMSQYLS